jgi:hypothetical protein
MFDPFLEAGRWFPSSANSLAMPKGLPGYRDLLLIYFSHPSRFGLDAKVVMDCRYAPARTNTPCSIASAGLAVPP